MLDHMISVAQSLPFIMACIIFGWAFRSAAGDFHSVECIAWQHCVWTTGFMVWWFAKVIIALLALLAIVLLPTQYT